jgi:hypothetical protein
MAGIGRAKTFGKGFPYSHRAVRGAQTATHLNIEIHSTGQAEAFESRVDIRRAVATFDNADTSQSDTRCTEYNRDHPSNVDIQAAMGAPPLKRQPSASKEGSRILIVTGTRTRQERVHGAEPRSHILCGVRYTRLYKYSVRHNFGVQLLNIYSVAGPYLGRLWSTIGKEVKFNGKKTGKRSFLVRYKINIQVSLRRRTCNRCFG